jgi:DNA-binding LytR/AlgR family response regulator
MFSRVIKAVIIEDEVLVAKNLCKLLNEVSAERAASGQATIEVLATLDSLHTAMAWFQANAAPDVLFCDIQLSDGVSFDLFHAHSAVSIACPVIFTTAYDEYALRAFKLNSIDYLLKPIDRDELAAALAKLERWQSANAFQPDVLARQMVALLDDVREASGWTGTRSQRRFKERFLVHGKGGMLLIERAHVAYFLKNEVIYCGTMDGKRFLTDYETLEELEDVLNPADFFRANRQTILSLHTVEGFKTELSGKLHVTLKPPLHFTVDVSREKASAFKRWLG